MRWEKWREREQIRGVMRIMERARAEETRETRAKSENR